MTVFVPALTYLVIKNFKGDVYMSGFWERSFVEKQAMWGFERKRQRIDV